MRNLVLRSLETFDGARCVDLFQREDGSYGFEIYRRDAEALSSWFAIGGFAQQRFSTESDARSTAAQHAPWIAAK
tara:strand:- start:99 stop:323 length:225 start_codon:yes stop_codon:yes gene_type:complete